MLHPSRQRVATLLGLFLVLWNVLPPLCLLSVANSGSVTFVLATDGSAFIGRRPSAVAHTHVPPFGTSRRGRPCPSCLGTMIGQDVLVGFPPCNCCTTAQMERKALCNRGGASLLAAPSDSNEYYSTGEKCYFLPAYTTRSSGSVTTSATNVQSYHLLWSPGTWKKIGTSLILLMLLRFGITNWSPKQHDALPKKILFSLLQYHPPGCAHDVTTSTHPTSAETSSSFSTTNFVTNIFQTLVLPLLSSACCSIQLLINALVGAGGCAGFNTYLGPVRPYFISYLFYTTISTFPKGSTTSHFNRWIYKTCMSWFISLMPEMVHAWNISVSRWKKGIRTHDEDTVKVVFELDIPSMGCVACINKIDSTMRHAAPKNVVDAKSWLVASQKKGGRARVIVTSSSEEKAREVADSVAHAVRGAGFDPCTVDKFEME